MLRDDLQPLSSIGVLANDETGRLTADSCGRSPDRGGTENQGGEEENGEKEKNFFINYINVNDKFIIVKFQLLKIFF